MPVEQRDPTLYVRKLTKGEPLERKFHYGRRSSRNLEPYHEEEGADATETLLSATEAVLEGQAGA